MPGRELSWLPQSMLDRMQTDLIAHEGLTRAALAEKIAADAAPLAAYTLVELATTSEDENIRMRSSMYLLDRELGKPKTSIQLDRSAENPVLKFLDGVVVERPVAPDYAADDAYGPDPDTYEDQPPRPVVIDQAPRNPFNPEDHA